MMVSELCRRLRFGRFDVGFVIEYLDVVMWLYVVIVEMFGVWVVVDFMKCSSTVWLFMRVLGIDLCVVHIVCDLWGVVNLWNWEVVLLVNFGLCDYLKCRSLCQILWWWVIVNFMIGVL